MAMAMGPPVLPGFSLRVQLFSPISHALTDKPIRNFRVVTSPDATVREFCQEASRIHEINYGEPIAIKKCQDDQEFDVTQSEIVGALFGNTATIRIIQALAIPGARDSVPPTSALRFDPASNISRKREREGNGRPNGSASSNAWARNKRQRVSDLDPDLPIVSRETDLEVGDTTQEEETPRELIVIPDSQHNDVFAADNEQSRHVRPEAPRIPETPSPSPPPAAHEFTYFGNGTTDHHGQKSAVSHADEHLPSQISIPSPFGVSSVRAQAQNPSRSRSASYHIQRATEQGTSVSTAATSPLSGDQQDLPRSVFRSANTTKKSDPLLNVGKPNKRPGSRTPDQGSIYENIASDDEGSAILRRTKEKLKIRNRTSSGLPGLEWTSTFNTPPNGSRRTSRSQELTYSNGELPRTPNSKEVEVTQRQREEADATRKAKVAAAEAAEQRKRKADEARAAEEKERLRKVREKNERAAQEERNLVIAKAAWLEKERIDKIERDQKLKEEKKAEENRREQARLQKEREQAERLERENNARLEKEKKQAEMLEREKAKAEEAKRVLEEAEKRRAKDVALAVEEMRKSKEKEKAETLGRTRSSRSAVSAESSGLAKESTPDRTRATPLPPQSSTPFIPSGRKSALKSSISSSQAAASSSPALIRNSSTASINVDDSLKGRRVSFDLKEGHSETPIKPPTRILPPKYSTPKPTDPVPSAVAPIIEKISTTPIPVPSIAKRSTPLVQSTIVPPRLGITTKHSIPKITPPVTTKKSVSPVTSLSSQKNIAPNSSRNANEPSKPAAKLPVMPAAKPPVQPEIITISSYEVSSDDDDDENIPSRVSSVKALNTSLRTQNRSPALPLKLVIENKESDAEDEDVDMASTRSSGRESRSPVVFNSQATSRSLGIVAQIPNPAPSTSDDSDEEPESSDGSEDSNEDEEDEPEHDKKAAHVQVPKSSSPSLPPAKAIEDSAQPNKNQQRKSFTTIPGLNGDEEDCSTQDEVDYQLTSSMFEVQPPVSTTPIPVPSSSNAARPKFKIGASLSTLNAQKPIVGSSPGSAKGNLRAQALKLDDQESSEEESEEESDDFSGSSDSDSEENSKDERLKLSFPPKTGSRSKASDKSDSESESDSGSEEGESEDETTKARNELAADIAKMSSNTNAYSQSSTQSWDGTPITPQSGTLKKADVVTGRASASASEKRKVGRLSYLTGYVFSQPK